MKSRSAFAFHRSTLRALAVGASFVLTDVSLAQDSFEPDDTASTAKTIINGQIQNRSLSAGDQDWATFTLGAAGAANLRIETAAIAGNSGDTEIWLYAAQNLTKELAYNDDGPTGKFSLITLSTLPAGTYLIKVAAVGVESTVSGYTLRASWTDRPDSFEPDNTAATAKAIANGQSQDRSIHTADDEDWATFTIGSDGATNLKIATTGPSGDTELTLFGPNSATTQVAYNDDGGGTKFSQITLSTLAAGTYFIKVTSFGLTSTISAYTLQASWTDRGDAFESDDTPATAKAIANAQTQNRSIHVPGDVDWATFTIGSNGAANVRIETAGSSGDTELSLFGPNSTTALLDHDDDGGAGNFSLIARNGLAPGTYYIKVNAFGLTTISAYTLKASWADGVPPTPGDIYEPDNTDSTAKPIANGQTQNRSIHVAADVDWATFTIGVNGATNVRIETAGSSGDTEMWLYGPNSAIAQIAYNDDGGSGGFSVITMPSLTAGTYYIKVAAFGLANPISAYTLRTTWVDGVPSTSRLANLSIRTSAGTGSQTVIVGFVLSGPGLKQLLLRGVGPTLSNFGVTGVLADPSLQLFSGSTSVATNDNWGPNVPIRDAAAAVGAFTLADTSRDSALLQNLSAGPYTAQIGGGTGVVLVEAYEVGSTVSPRLSNVSARAQAGTGANTLIAGFVIAGQGVRNVLIRAVGPGLTQFGVTGVLADPKLEVFSGTTLIETNDNWDGAPVLNVAFAQVGAFALPANSRDSVLLMTLQPGAYSAQITGVGGTTGTALVEVYEIP